MGMFLIGRYPSAKEIVLPLISVVCIPAPTTVALIVSSGYEIKEMSKSELTCDFIGLYLHLTRCDTHHIASMPKFFEELNNAVIQMLFKPSLCEITFPVYLNRFHCILITESIQNFI